MFCKNCRKEINGSFCPWCGTKVDIVETKKEPMYIENKNKIEKENKIENKKTKKSKTKIFLVCGMIVFALTIISLVLLSYFNIINIPALFSQQSPVEETLSANTVVFDENNVGEIYFYQTEAENIVTSTEGFMYVDNEILLVANDKATYADIEKLAKNYEAEIVGWIEQTGDYQLQLNQTYTYAELEKFVTSLKNENIIQDAYINFAFETNVNKTEERNGFIYGDEWEKDLQNFNNSQGKSWGIEAIESLAAWDVLDANKKNVNPIKVGLIDCGFDTTHEDLGFAETFYNNVTRLDHGTHVAGTMAAKANNQEGVCGVYPYGDGNLYGVSFDGMKTYSENTTTSMCLKIAYSELILRNVKVINTSWGFQYKEAGLKYTDPEWKEQVDFLESNAYLLGDFLNRLLDKGYDFVLVTSAGNNSDRKNNIVYDSKYNYWTAVISEEDYPKVHDRIIVVGAVDSNFEICNFSDGGDRVDIYAPGDTIFSTIPNNKYENKDWSGTSMAAPHVSGVAAMVWSVNNNLTGAQAKEIICSSHSFRCNSCDMIDAYIALQKAARLKTDESNDNTEYGGILCWVVSAKNVNTKVQNATVILTSQQSGEEFITTTDAFGHFEFFVPAGKYSLSVKAEDYEDYFSPGDYFIIVENNSINYLSDWIKIEPKYSNEDVLGTYKGSYFVNQEEIGLTLTVYDEGARYKATFDFYNLPGKSNTESGKYYMDVSYNISTDEYYFVATDWINQPTDYSTLDLEGKLVGNILSSESPTKFSVTKVTEDDALSKLLGTYKGSYFANQGETGLTLTVYKEDKEYKALFDFYNLPGNNNAKSGKYYMDVSYDIFTDEYTFTATEWIEQPSSYYLLDLKGKLADNTLSGESPTKFSLTKVSDSDSTETIWNDIPESFTHTSGAGTWSTSIKIDKTGNFVGEYRDSDMGIVGNSYPNGTHYLCNFSGRFTEPKQISEYVYSMQLESLEIENTLGEEYYEDGIRYIYSTPSGIDNGKEFLIYMPGTPVSDMNEDFLSWSFVNTSFIETLPSGMYGIYNVEQKTGFIALDQNTMWSNTYTYNFEDVRSTFSPSYSSQSRLTFWKSEGAAVMNLGFNWERNDQKQFVAQDYNGSGKYDVTIEMSADSTYATVTIISRNGYDLSDFGGSEDGNLVAKYTIQT